MMRRLRVVWDVIGATLTAFMNDRVGTMAAALAYFTFFSIAPMIIVAIAVAGLFFGQEAAQGALSHQLESLVGKVSAEAVEDLVKSASGKKSGVLATIMGTLAIMFGATGVFAELQESLNTVWKAPALKINKVAGFFRTRFLSFSAVLGVGFLLLVSLMTSVALSTICEWMGQCDATVGKVTERLVSFGITTVLFGFIFKLLPDVKVAWRHVWLGAVVTAVLFTIGKSILGYVLSQTSVLSTYGTAASLAALLLWVHYSSLILLLGAELSYVIASRAGAKPEEHVDAPWAEGAEPSHGEAGVRHASSTLNFSDRSTP